MATPRSTREKVNRIGRMGAAKIAKSPDIAAGKFTPKKTGNNDPRRGGNVLHCTAEEQILALGNVANMIKWNNKGTETIAEARKCKDLIEMLISIRLNDWREDGEEFVNESGRRVSKKNFKLLEDGRLVTLKGNIPNYDLDWLLDLRGLIQ